jgi:hypothetical protein
MKRAAFEARALNVTIQTDSGYGSSVLSRFRHCGFRFVGMLSSFASCLAGMIGSSDNLEVFSAPPALRTWRAGKTNQATMALVS